MRKAMLFLLMLGIFSGMNITLFSQTEELPPEEVQMKPPAEETVKAEFSDLNIPLGDVRFPRIFVHAGKEYPRAIYYLTLTAKGGVPYFNVHNRAKELLFEEMAVVKPYQGKVGQKKPRITREMLSGYEYFRIGVTQPGNTFIAYFLSKQKPQETPVQKDPAKESESMDVEETTQEEGVQEGGEG